ncbi:hypothetical protein [Ruegeria hyattellae]|uniref:hypothetical protein n=1 Tax=Ruegeria hyattellae TaxID=3233337 RepID=UPI00355B38B3
MTDLNKALGWSDPIPWGEARLADAIPDDIKTGMWVRSDMIFRPSMALWLTEPGYPPAYCPDQMWQVIDGESFRREVEEPKATHAVASWYRILAGELPEEVAQVAEEPIDEEALLQALIDAQREGEAA